MDSSNNHDCCPEFNPNLWDDKIIEWKNKKFVKDKVFTFFYMPMNFGNIMRKLDKKVREAKAEMSDFLCLSEHTSKWNMDVFLAVDKDIPKAENVTFDGKFYSKIYEGPFKDTGKWMNNFDEVCKSKNLKYSKIYMWYTTCPKCAKKYGKNYVAIIAKLA